jgi:hypothetical protein
MAGAAVAFACPEGKRQKWEGDAQKAKGKSGKGMLNAFRHLSGGCLYIFYLLPFAFCLLPFLALFQSAIQNRVSALRRS